MRRLLLLTLSLAVFFGFAFQKKEMLQISPEEKEELVNYLKTHGKSPEDYVVEKFKDYDLVFIGEFHRIKHDLELIHDLIPRLYQAGVYNLGIEFGAYEMQEKVDSLITADEYDESLAREIMFKWSVYWGNKEYMDIYRNAWELNKSLPESAQKFRVVNLNYRPDWTALQENMSIQLWRKVWHKGNPDVHMADVIFKEFVDKRQKALIYSGTHHSFTHYYQPVYDYGKKNFVRFTKNRMGNLVYQKLPDRVFHIVLHKPWQTKEGEETLSYPVGGVIDQVMREFKDKRIGFDVKDSPFGRLRDEGTYYAFGYEDFALSAFCDGYIFQKHFKDYEGCTVDTKFITEKNFKEAVDYFDEFGERKNLRTIKDFINLMRERADIKKRLRAQGLE